MPLDVSKYGPVQVAMIGFPGNRFTGDIAPALAEAVSKDLIRIIDLVFVLKDDGEDVTAVELSTLPADVVAAYGALGGDDAGLLDDDDLAALAEDLEPGNSGLVVVWEATWAGRLATAIRDSGGELLELALIPHEAIEEMAEALAGA